MHPVDVYFSLRRALQSFSYPRRRSRDKSTLNNALILSPLYFITGKHKLQIMLSNRVSVSTKTPYISKFTICFISITIRLLPMSIHSLIYDNTPSHNSSICIAPSPSPPPPPPNPSISDGNPVRERLPGMGFNSWVIFI